MFSQIIDFIQVQYEAAAKLVKQYDVHTLYIFKEVLMLICFLSGVGVPLMLTYVYGVVPMSLCRNGWCRPQNEPPDTHKIQLEDLASCEYSLQFHHGYPLAM